MCWICSSISAEISVTISRLRFVLPYTLEYVFLYEFLFKTRVNLIHALGQCGGWRNSWVPSTYHWLQLTALRACSEEEWREVHRSPWIIGHNLGFSICIMLAISLLKEASEKKFEIILWLPISMAFFISWNSSLLLRCQRLVIRWKSTVCKWKRPS
jgi:hypothetical protein